MAVLRSVVFPSLRLLVWAVIAVSLAWLAFGRADPPPQEVATPSFTAGDPEVAAARGTVENIVTLQGGVTADPAVPQRATAAGTIARLRVEVGDAVEPGAPLLTITTEVPAEVPEPVAPVAPAPGAPAAPPAPVEIPEPEIVTTVVRASVAGTVTSLDVLLDQQVAVGDAVAAVSPGTLTVTASVSQEQQFRLLTPPAVAEVTVPGGPAPFPCAAVRIGPPDADAPANPAPPDPYADPYAPAPGPTTGALTCRVPPGSPVFAGMSASVELQAGVATDVLVLPVTAVEGSVSTGTVWLPDPAGGEPVEREVRLGLTDGTQVEIVEGLADGEQVLEFVPGADPAQGQFPPGVIVGPGG